MRCTRLALSQQLLAHIHPMFHGMSASAYFLSLAQQCNTILQMEAPPTVNL
jgi:hypothetical protein